MSGLGDGDGKDGKRSAGKYLLFWFVEEAAVSFRFSINRFHFTASKAFLFLSLSVCIGVHIWAQETEIISVSSKFALC